MKKRSSIRCEYLCRVTLLAAMHAALVKELGEDPEQSEARWRAGATPEAPQGILNDKKPTARSKGSRQ